MIILCSFLFTSLQCFALSLRISAVLDTVGHYLRILWIKKERAGHVPGRSFLHGNLVTRVHLHFLCRITMSTAHRPTWDPAQAKDVKGGSRQFSVRDMAAHTKLKFRFVKIVIFRFLL